ncbi:MAG: hypothetical protein ACRBDL_02050 [Alphaproteobacteria bacterium]
MTYSPEQVGAALGLLRMTWSDLSRETGITNANLNKWRNRDQNFTEPTMQKVIAFIDNHNLRPTPNDGIEHKPAREIEDYYGIHGFRAFMNDVYETVKEHGGNICVSNVNERNWIKWMGEEHYEAHSVKMKNLGNFKFKIFVEESDSFFIADKFAEYKSVPRKYFTEQSFYSYGQKLALLEFTEDNVSIKIHNNPEWARSFKDLFDYAWDKTPELL